MKRRLSHLVLINDPHPSSHAASILLKEHLRSLAPNPATNWLQYRDSVVSAVLKVTPILTCEYCNRTNLLSNIGSTTTHPNMVTLDHLVPRSRGGSDELTNLVLSCSPCNRKKDAKPPTPAQRSCRRISDILGTTTLTVLPIAA